jgi:phage terminase Nu1 subunit (DNA packaging protein)
MRPRKGGPRTKEQEEAEKSQDSLQRRILQANALKSEEDARAAKLRNDEAEGLLIARAEVTREWAEHFSQARTILEAFPDQFAKEAPAKLRASAHELALKSIERVMRTLAAVGVRRDSE